MADQIETRRAAGPEEQNGWALVVALILLALILWLVAARRQAPAPKPADAPAAEFSGARALGLLREMIGDGRPHPTGSPANAAIRDRIVARLRELGYSPEVRADFACGPMNNSCARVENVVARLEGTARDGAVLLMSHYDSVPAGPGAGDDVAGVAAMLEVARALKNGPPPKNPVILLFSDGEELGLIGAQAFADSPQSREVKVIVNLEARGSSGPSLMFESIGDNGWLIPLLAAGAPHPVTSSVFVTIYEMMPNNTDLTVFKRPGVHGLNFAFLENPMHYHTSADSVENLSPASLQHHGDNALGVVRQLAQADLANPPAGKAVFFDVLGWSVVSWPVGWTVPLAVLTLLVIVSIFVVAKRRGRTSFGGLVLGLVAFLASVLMSGLVAYGLVMVVGGALQVPWVAHPFPLLAAFWLIPLMMAGLLLPGLGRRAGAGGLYVGVWLAWSLAGLALAFVAPGISYLFLVPALIAGVAGHAYLRGGAPTTGAVAVLLPVLIAGLLWFPILIPLYDGLGSTALLAIAVLLAMLVAALAPLYAVTRPLVRWAVTGLALAGVIAGLAVALTAAPYAPRSPQAVSIQYHLEADSGRSRWLVFNAPPFPQELRQAAEFGADREPAYPWTSGGFRTWQAPAPRLEQPGPNLVVLEDVPAGNGRRVRALLTSDRGAPAAMLMVPRGAKLESMSIDGRPVKIGGGGGQGQQPDYRSVQLMTLPPDGAEIELVLGERAPQEWYVGDRSYELPPFADALQKARPPATVRSQDGDTTLVTRKVRI
jgi:hypothetical protein